MNKLQQSYQIFSNMGLRYFWFRVQFEIKKKTRILKLKFPSKITNKNVLTLDYWKKNKKPYLFQSSKDISIAKCPSPELSQEAGRIINGSIKYFSGETYDLGKDYDWITNPSNGYKYDIKKHWTEVQDYSTQSGDIKFVWEKSRFTFIYTLIRDEQINGTDHSSYIFGEINSWISANPLNYGPNYKCSQEISLRVLNWIFALYYYSDKNVIDQITWELIMDSIAGQMHHVFANINFSRIAVRNNHAITETLALFIVGTLFPHFDNSKKWVNKGKKWIEEEVSYQIYDDGTFLQFSMNYHRVLIQLLTLGLIVAERNDNPFSSLVYVRAYKSLNFLFQCQEGPEGMLPNYGANDGALFFPLNHCEYRDYSPQLNALHKFLTHKNLYENTGEWEEDSEWLGLSIEASNIVSFEPIKKLLGIQSFINGGYYLIRDKRTFTFIRCGKHKDRPSQADNLHIDIWVDGKNILPDSGSYKYNTAPAVLRYFMGTRSHNSLMINDEDQMLKGSRFIWYYWTQAIEASLTEDSENFYFSGKISAFRWLNPKIMHERQVTIAKNTTNWLVYDKVHYLPGGSSIYQLWHLNPGYNLKNSLKITSNGAIDTNLQGSYSSKYGFKVSAPMFAISSSEPELTTEINYLD